MNEQQHSGKFRRSASERLSSIGHHFLGDEHTHPQTAAPPPSNIVAIIAAHRQRPFPTLVLAAQLAQQGVDCRIRTSGKPEILLRTNPQENHQPASIHAPESLALTIVEGANHYPSVSIDTLLLATPATASGLRDGYIQLKQCLQSVNVDRIGVTLTDCRNRDQASQYFALLRQACQNFLAMNLHSYGALGVHGEHAPESVEVAGIARLLIADHAQSLAITTSRVHAAMDES